MRLNAPYGARCYLTQRTTSMRALRRLSLNAPYGARCFLTRDWFDQTIIDTGKS